MTLSRNCDRTVVSINEEMQPPLHGRAWAPPIRRSSLVDRMPVGVIAVHCRWERRQINCDCLRRAWVEHHQRSVSVWAHGIVLQVDQSSA